LADSTKKYDVFISHASEDKDEIVRPLVVKLGSLGLKVWYDEFTLHIGDSLTESVDKGISDSHYGILILSKNFFAKKS
jgi:TIR domain